jgi:hypothetical protein
VSRARTLATVGALLAAVWGLLVFAVVKPVTAADYRRNVLQVAESAHDAARTGWLAGRQVLAGQTFSPYAQTAFDDAGKALAGAMKQFASEAPPGAASRQLRDQLAPLLDSALHALGDATDANDDDDQQGLRDAVDALGKAAGQLDDFIEGHR